MIMIHKQTDFIFECDQVRVIVIVTNSNVLLLVQYRCIINTVIGTQNAHLANHHHHHDRAYRVPIRQHFV